VDRLGALSFEAERTFFAIGTDRFEPIGFIGKGGGTES
jgi:hypothetical protein